MNANVFNPTCASLTVTPYSNIQQEITRFSVIGQTIPQVDWVYSQISFVRNILLFFLYIKHGNLLLPPSIEYNGLTYTINDDDNVTESDSDILNNQKVYEAIIEYFQYSAKTQVGVSITYVHPTNQTKNHNSVVIIRKNGPEEFVAFHYETIGIIAEQVMPILYNRGPPVIQLSLIRMFSGNNIIVHTNRSPTLNQAIIQQIQNKREGGMCIVLSLFVIYLSFFANVQNKALSPGGTPVISINMECFTIPEDVQLNCIRGFLKEASDEIMQSLYPLGNLATAFSITEISKLYQSDTVEYKSNKLIYLGEVLKYIISGLKDGSLSLPNKPSIQPQIDLLSDTDLKNYTKIGFSVTVTETDGRRSQKYGLTEYEKKKILNLFKNANEKLKKITSTNTIKRKETINANRNKEKKGGSTKKKKRKTKRRSKKRKTKRKY